MASSEWVSGWVSASTFRFLQGMLEMGLCTGNVSPALTQMGGPVA